MEEQVRTFAVSDESGTELETRVIEGGELSEVRKPEDESEDKE